MSPAARNEDLDDARFRDLVVHAAVMRSAHRWCKRTPNRQRPERTRMLDRQAQIRPTRVQSSGERHKRPGPVKSPPTRDAPDERNGLATCSQSVPRKTAQMATPLATNIPSVAPVTNPIAQHHQLGISFHQAIRRLASEIQFLHNNAPLRPVAP